jgi:uncharacterized protein YaaN involved in tellurite resistance
MAPLGKLGLTTLRVSTTALAGNDAIYATLEAQLATLTQQRDALAAQMIPLLEGAEFSGHPISFEQILPLVLQAEGLIKRAHELQSGR